MKTVQAENDLNIRHLRIFLSVCENGNNLSRAAEAMYTTQPAVSLVIHDLEEHYQIALFDRLGRRLYLTPAGEQFRTYALRVLSLIDDMEMNMNNLGGAAPLRIGGSITVGSQLMPDWVSIFKKLHPNVQINVRIRHSQELGELIQKNQLDIAVVEAPVDTPVLVLEQFLEDDLVVLAAPGTAEHGCPLYSDRRMEKTVSGKERDCDRLCAKIQVGESSPNAQSAGKMDVDDFVRLPFLLREKGSGTRYIVDHVMDELGVHIDPLWESESSLSLINAAKKGLGVTIVPRTVAKEFIERGEVCELHPQRLKFQQKFYLMRHKDKILSEPLQEFIALCRTHTVFAD